MAYRGGARPCHRGRVKQTPMHTLSERRCLGQDEVLGIWACRDDFTIPFNSNQTECDLRLRKGQHKVSGCFRSARSADAFACRRSYLSALRKHGAALLAALATVVVGQPLSPAFV